MSRSGPAVCPAAGHGEAGVSPSTQQQRDLQAGDQRQKEGLALAGQRCVAGLPLHQKEATGLHDYGKAHVEDDGEQQGRRDELARRAIRCQLWIGFSQGHWRETRDVCSLWQLSHPPSISLSSFRSDEVLSLGTVIKSPILGVPTTNLPPANNYPVFHIFVIP